MNHPSDMPDLPPGVTHAVPLLEGHSHHRAHPGAFVLLHRLLRGRYLWVAILGTIGAIAGAAAGYLTQTPQYRCEAQVRVKSNADVLLKQIPENSMLPNPDREVNTQAALIASDRVISVAMKSEDWHVTGRGRDPQTEREFRESLRVISNREQAELITVSFTDRDAKAARAGLEAVLHAYEDIHLKTSDDEQKTRVLDEERRTLDKEITDLQRNIETLARPYGTEDLSRQQEALLSQKLELDRLAFEYRQLVTSFQSRAGAPPADAPADPGVKPPLTPQDIGAVDASMRELIKDRDDRQHLITELLQRGYKEEHRSVKAARQGLAAAEAAILDYAKRFTEGKVVPSNDLVSQSKTMTPDQVRVLLVNTEAQLEDCKRKSVELFQVKSKLDDMRAQLAQKKLDMRERVERIADLRRESGSRAQNQQRINIFWPMDTPSLPAVDKRMRMGAMGMVGGGGLPVALIALVGLWDHKRRFTYSDEARERGPGATLLGILPNLPRDLTDPEQCAAAAHCVHQMRTLLQIGGEDRKVYAITSSTAGDGKTSLALSLGMSFAASGARTLLIDFDMIGHGLSSALKCRATHGLVSALQARELNGSVMPTAIPRLSLLPAGREDDRFVSRLSRSMVRELIDRARAEYDVVVVDTGPILGSLEANYVSSEADGVVLVVGRGQNRGYVDRAFEQLHALGARVAGMVFNRASTTDFLQSATSTSFRSVRDEPAKPVDPKDMAEFESVARTVALDIQRHDEPGSPANPS